MSLSLLPVVNTEQGAEAGDAPSRPILELEAVVASSTRFQCL